jgi:aminoglycoside 6'-N-acetyltransferase
MSVDVRPMRWDELPLLLHWFSQPHVKEWWRDEPADLAGVEAVYGACITGEDPMELFVIESTGRPVGMVQRFLIADEPEWFPAFDGIVDVADAAGMDYLIGEVDAVGRGVGTAVITTFASMVFAWRPVDSIVVTVQQTNVASWRILEKAGFTRVWEGVLDSPDPSDDGPQYVYRLPRGRQPLPAAE